MKFSIKSVFNNLLILLLIVAFFLAFLSFITFKQHIIFKKLNTLQSIQNTINKMDSPKKTQVAYSIIILNSLTEQLDEEFSHLKDISKDDYISKIFGYNKVYLNNIKKLENLSLNYSNLLKIYLQSNNKNVKRYLMDIVMAKESIINEINNIQTNNTKNQYKIFSKLQWLVYFIFLLSFFILLHYKKRLRLIYQDIELLYGINISNNKIPTLTKEADAIKVRMIRKPIVADNSSMIDPNTQIKNYKGMMHAYADKKGIKEKNFTTVCLFEIDNFSNYNNLSKDFLQTILKKVAFIMSLYEQTTDVIARTDYNQFIVVLSRDSKHKAFQECEAIRQSIEEVMFKPSKSQKITITLSGGFILKLRNKTLEETIKEAKELLTDAQTEGGNRIIQIKHHSEIFD